MDSLQQNIEALRARLNEAEQILYAIAHHEVDAFVVNRAQGEQVYKLQGAEHPYRVIVETINEGAATLLADGTITYCNPAFATLLKLPHNQIIGTTLADFVSPEGIGLYMALVEQGLSGSSRGEIRLQAADGTLTPVLLSCSSLQLEEVLGVCLVATDLTGQKQQQEMLAAEKLTRSILEQVAEAVVVCDLSGRILRANRQALQLCGRNPILQPFEQMFPLQWGASAQSDGTDLSPSAQGAGTAVAQPDFTLAARLQRGAVRNQEIGFVDAGGRFCHLLLNAAPLLDGKEEQLGFVITLIDISERKEIEEVLRNAGDELEQRVAERTQELSEANQRLQQEIAERRQVEADLAEVRHLVTQSQETERLRLAQELHDGPLQDMSALRFDLSELASSLADEAAVVQVVGISKHVEEIARRLRQVAQNLRPPILAHLGLPATLRLHAQQLQTQQTTVVLELILSEETWPVAEECALSLFRIYQQAVQNALQHANAHKITVQLTYEEEQLNLMIKDDGCGFHIPNRWLDLARKGHLGMVGIVERAEAIGGHAAIISQPGQGTCVHVTVPKPPENSNQDNH